jgi:hypothetical protein
VSFYEVLLGLSTLFFAGMYLWECKDHLDTRRELENREFDLAEADTAPWVRNR